VPPAGCQAREDSDEGLKEREMESKKPQVPPEAVEAYNKYIHGEINRRDFMERVTAVAGAFGVTTLVQALMPDYASAQKVSPTDARIRIEKVMIPSPMGNGTINGYLARPAAAGTAKLPGILVVHENRGRNPHMEDIARRLAVDNFMALAPDGLTSVGGYPGDD
jgi:carboxymethylenebutenolidase